MLATAEDVTITGVTTNSATVLWTIPSFVIPEQYYIAYGSDPDNLTQSTTPISSPTDTTFTNQVYTTTISGLNPGTFYYIRVIAIYDEIFLRYTEDSFITYEPGEMCYTEFL